MARLLALVAFLVIGFASCHVYDSRRVAKARSIGAANEAKREIAAQEKRVALARKHNAFILSSKAISELSYAIDYQRAFMSTNQQTILVTADLDDIYQEKGNTILRFVIPNKFQHRIFLELETSLTREELPRGDRWESPRFEVVALITTVNRPMLEAVAVMDDGYPRIQVENTEIVVGKGQCLELAALPSREQ